MGQARKRGTFEERKAQALQRQEQKRLEDKARQLQHAEKMAAFKRKQDENHAAALEAWEAAGADPATKPVHPRHMAERRRQAVVGATALAAGLSSGIGVLR